jgi:hypothetical protein
MLDTTALALSSFMMENADIKACLEKEKGKLEKGKEKVKGNENLLYKYSSACRNKNSIRGMLMVLYSHMSKEQSQRLVTFR